MFNLITFQMILLLWRATPLQILQKYIPMLGCFNNLQILASRSSFWWSENEEMKYHTCQSCELQSQKGQIK